MPENLYFGNISNQEVIPDAFASRFALEPHVARDRFIISCFRDSQYRLPQLLELQPDDVPHPLSLSPAEVAVVCSRANAGDVPVYSWGKKVLERVTVTGSNLRPLLDALDVLRLVSPIADVREGFATSLSCRNFPHLSTVMLAALRCEHHWPTAHEWLVSSNYFGTAQVFSEMVEAAAANRLISPYLEIDQFRAQVQTAFKEEAETGKTLRQRCVGGSFEQKRTWHLPNLATCAVLLATSATRDDFTDHINTLIRDFPDYAIPVLAAVSNTPKEHIREFALAASEHEFFKPTKWFAPLLRQLPVSALKSCDAVIYDSRFDDPWQ